MKAYRFIISLSILVFIFCVSCLGKSAAAESKKPMFPLSIEALRLRVYPGSEITVEKQIAATDKYTSFLFSYKSDDLKLYGLMYIPVTDDKNKKFPTVVVDHGYIPPEKYSTINSYHDISAYYASNGFLVFKPDYRGHASSQGSAIGPFRSVYYSIDVLNLISSIKTYPKTDINRLLIYGHSMGGEVTLRVLEISNDIKAATLWAPVSAPFPENTLFYVRMGGEKAVEEFETTLKKEISPGDYDSISPLYFTEYIKVPILLQHGTADQEVPYDWSLRLNKEFDRTGVKYDFITYEGENHNLNVKSYPTVKRRDIEFFNRILNAQK